MKHLLAAGFIAVAWPALAADLPAIDMTTRIIDEYGKPAIDLAQASKDDPDCAKCPPLTLGLAISHALFASFTDEKPEATAEQKWARAVLANRIRDQKAAQLTVDETAVIKRLLGHYGGVLLMQALPLIDPNAQPPAVK